MKNKVLFGRTNEAIAAKFLSQSGMIISERNWFYKHFGEIDIIAFDKQLETLVFVEVRSQTTGWLDSSQIIPRQKLARLRRLVECWLSMHRLNRHELFVRLDLVVINTLGLNWYKAIG